MAIDLSVDASRANDADPEICWIDSVDQNLAGDRREILEMPSVAFCNDYG